MATGQKAKRQRTKLVCDSCGESTPSICWRHDDPQGRFLCGICYRAMKDAQ